MVSNVMSGVGAALGVVSTGQLWMWDRHGGWHACRHSGGVGWRAEGWCWPVGEWAWACRPMVLLRPLWGRCRSHRAEQVTAALSSLGPVSAGEDGLRATGHTLAMWLVLCRTDQLGAFTHREWEQLAPVLDGFSLMTYDYPSAQQ